MTETEYRRLMRTPMPAGVYSIQIIQRYFSLVLGRELDANETRTTIDRINGEANRPERLAGGTGRV